MARVPTSANLSNPSFSGGRAPRNIPTVEVPGNFQVPVADLPNQVAVPRVDIPTPDIPNSVPVTNDIRVNADTGLASTLYTGADRAALAGPGRALENLGGVVADEGQRWGTYLRGLEMGKAKTAMVKGLTQLDLELADDPDYTTHAERYNQGAARVKADAISHLTTAQEQQAFSDDFDMDVLKTTESIKKQAQAKEADKGRAELTTLLKVTREQLNQPGLTADRKARLVETADEAVDNLQELGYIDAENAEKLKSGFKSDVAVDDQSQKIADGKYDEVREDLDGGKALANMRRAAPEVQESIAIVAERTGVGATWLAEIANAESSFNPTAKNPASSATGLYQFTDATWLDAFRKSRKALKERYGVTVDLNKLTDAQILAARNDPLVASVVMAEHTVENIATLEENLGGRYIGLKDAYLAHVMGAKGAFVMLKAMEMNPDASAEALFPKEAKSNPTLFQGKTVSEAYAAITGKVGDGKPSFAYENLDPKTRLSLKISADSNEHKRRTQLDAEDKARKAKIESLTKDDESSLEETGVGLDPDRLDPNEVVELLGPERAAEHAQRREIALAKYEAKTGLENLRDDEIEARLEALTPQAGTDGYAAQRDVYEAVTKKAKDIIDLREKDPALAVEQTPEVQLAVSEAEAAQAEATDAEGVSVAQPQQIGRIAKARMAAQERLDIRADLRSPITRDESKKLMARLAGLDTGGTKAAWTDVVNEVEMTYGKDLAKQVLASAIGYEIGDKAQGELVTNLLNKAVKSGRFTQQDFAPFMQLDELRWSDGFMNPSPEFAAQADVPPSVSHLRAGGTAARATGATRGLNAGPRVSIPKKAVDHLKANPALLDSFSRKYGIPADEARQKYLGQ